MEEYRGYSISFSKDFIAFEVEYIGRGSAHNSLRGYFTDKRTAKKFIDVYLDRKEGKSGKVVQRS